MRSIADDRPDAFRRRVAIVALAATTVLMSAACASGTSDSATPATRVDAPKNETIAVAASFYPIAEAATRVGGDRVEVQNLTPPGGGPHDLELQPQQVNDLSEADALFFVSKGFQPQVEKAAAELPDGVRSVDVLEGIDLLPVQDQLEGTQGEVDGEELEGGYDPHVWVDPILQSQIAQRVHDVLVEIDPAGKADYDSRLAAYQAELASLDSEFEAGLATCGSRVIVTSHRAFEYLAKRYDLTQISIAGLSPDEEPDPRTLEAVAAAAQRENVSVVFFEEQVPPDLSETVAREIGARTDALDPVETITQEDLDAGTTYTTVMQANLESLTEGLSCT